MEPLLHSATRQQARDLAKYPKGSYIFYGPEGIGRFSTWLWLITQWHPHEQESESCGRCLQIQARTYPDLVVVEPEGESIGIAQIHHLQHTLQLTPYDQVGLRLVIIDAADKLTLEAQNALLKALEEPPERTIIGLIATTPLSLTTTLRSRTQAINFLSIPPDLITAHLVNNYQVDKTQAQQLADLSAGRPGRAIRFSSDPNYLQQFQEASDAARQLYAAKLFDKLKLAGQLGDSKTIQVPLLTEILYKKLRQELRQQLSKPEHGEVIRLNRALEAVLRFESHLKGNVTLKAALGALALELSQ